MKLMRSSKTALENSKAFIYFTIAFLNTSCPTRKYSYFNTEDPFEYEIPSKFVSVSSVSFTIV